MTSSNFLFSASFGRRSPAPVFAAVIIALAAGCAWRKVAVRADPHAGVRPRPGFDRRP